VRGRLARSRPNGLSQEFLHCLTDAAGSWSGAVGFPIPDGLGADAHPASELGLTEAGSLSCVLEAGVWGALAEPARKLAAGGSVGLEFGGEAESFVTPCCLTC
jgi:hypothetical protein